MDAFIYSPLLPKETAGMMYSGLMHVSDWFPTILELADISFTPAPGQELDGVSHAQAFRTLHTSNGANAPRDHILYNIYTNIESEDFNIETNGALGIRKDRYKLLHAFVDNPYSGYYEMNQVLADDGDLKSQSCPQFLSVEGNYTRFLFDLEEDPSEKFNLYDEPSLDGVKAELYSLINYYAARTALDVNPKINADIAESFWEQQGNIVLPWKSDPEETMHRTPPSRCVPYDSPFSSN